MALLFMDGFDHYLSEHLLRKWDFVTGSPATISTNGGRRGGGCFRAAGASVGLGKALGHNVASGVVGFAYYPEAQPTTTGGGQHIVTLRDGTTNQISLWHHTDGTLRVTVGGSGAVSGTVIAISSAPLPIAAWNFIELKATIHDSAGAFEVRVDGQTWVAAAGLNTRGSANNFFNRLWLGETGGNDQNARWDDLYLVDTSGSVNNDFLGDVRIDVLAPNAAGTYDDFTPSPSPAELDTAYLYWRIAIRAWASTARDIANIEMRASVGGANQCVGGIASSSSGTAANAFDGSATTYCDFASASGQWIQYQFAAPVVVRELAIRHRSIGSNRTPSHFDVEASQDGVEFKAMGSYRVLDDWLSSETRLFELVSGVALVATPYPAEGTYLVGGEAGAKQLFTLAPTTELPAQDLVVAVQVNHYAAKSDAGGAAVRNRIRSGAAEEAGPTQALSTSFRVVRSIHELNPATGAPWLLSEAQAMEAGLEVVA